MVRSREVLQPSAKNTLGENDEATETMRCLNIKVTMLVRFLKLITVGATQSEASCMDAQMIHCIVLGLWLLAVE